MSNTEETNKIRLYIPRERSIRAGPLNLDYKTIWLALSVIASLIAIVVASNAGSMPAGLLFTIGVAVLYSVLFGLPGAAYIYRHGGRRISKFRGKSQDMSDYPETGETLGDRAAKPIRPRPIPQIGRIDFLPHETGGGVLGVAYDPKYGTYSTSMWAAGSSLLSANQSTQMDRLSAYAVLLDSMAEAGSSLHRFSWREQTLLGEPQNPAELVETIRQGGGLTREEPPNQDVLLQRTAAMGQSSVVHRTTMTLSVLAKDVKREARLLGKSQAGYLKVAQQRAEGFYALAMGKEYGHSSIGLKAGRFATYNDLLLENRLVLDPVFAQPLLQQWERPLDSEYLLDEHEAWPGYRNFEPSDYCQLGETFHMGFYITEFTRAGMPPDQLWNILKLPVSKTVTVVFQMVPPRRAQRFAEWSTSGASGSNVDRAEKRHRVTASQHRAANEAMAHETEVALDHGAVGRVRCYIDLTASSVDELRNNASKLKHACADARFLVEPLAGRQHLGIQAVMPIGRGLTALTESWRWLS